MKKVVVVLLILVGLVVISLGTYVDRTPEKTNFGGVGAEVQIEYKDGRIETYYPKPPLQQLLSLTAKYNGASIQQVKFTLLGKTDRTYSGTIKFKITGRLFFEYYRFEPGSGYQLVNSYKIFDGTTYGSINADGSEQSIMKWADNPLTHINKEGQWEIVISPYLNIYYCWSPYEESGYMDGGYYSTKITIEPIYVTSS